MRTFGKGQEGGGTERGGGDGEGGTKKGGGHGEGVGYRPRQGTSKEGECTERDVQRWGRAKMGTGKEEIEN